MIAAVIADIVGSRRLADRAAAQSAIDAAVIRAGVDGPAAREQLRPTVGDELQGVYDDLPAALASLLLIQLALPAGVECRFGVGIGEIADVPGAGDRIQDGPGWWAARDAVDIVHAKQQRAVPGIRTWVVASDAADDEVLRAVDMADAYLLARDQLVGAMSERARRLTYGRCIGRTQADLAVQEGISQPAVSQVLANAGAAAVVEGYRALMDGRAP